ncbi:MAG: radical SAM protein [Clostridia bacterium]
MNNLLEKCQMCPHSCKVNRLSGKLGRCKATANVKVALASLHYFEEPCISGDKGSGTIFFSACNLNCVFCQNSEISQNGLGKELSLQKLADVFLKMQSMGAHNINLVTPTIWIYQIIESIKIAKKGGLVIPIIYNSNGYENVESLKMLEGYIDVYLPDLKYAEDDLGARYSNVPNYFSTAKACILEMYRQVGSPVIGDSGIIQRGLIIRHLVLPSHVSNTKKCLKWIKDNLSSEVYVSVMAQYFPTYKAKDFPEICRKLSKEEYSEVMEYVEELDIQNGYMQELGEHEEEYVPVFNFDNLD